jgi:hypothetical protein
MQGAAWFHDTRYHHDMRCKALNTTRGTQLVQEERKAKTQPGTAVKLLWPDKIWCFGPITAFPKPTLTRALAGTTNTYPTALMWITPRPSSRRRAVDGRRGVVSRNVGGRRPGHQLDDVAERGRRGHGPLELRPLARLAPPGPRRRLRAPLGTPSSLSRRSSRQPRLSVQRCKLRIVTIRFGTARQKMALERWTTPTCSRRSPSPRYGVQSCGGKSAGVAKRPRERSPTRNPRRYDSQRLHRRPASGFTQPLSRRSLLLR